MKSPRLESVIPTRISLLLLLIAALTLTACRGDGSPSSRDAEQAMEQGVRYLLLESYPAGKAEVDFVGVSVSNCASQGHKWICHAEGEMKLQVPRNGETESKDKKFSGNLELSKEGDAWVVVNYPMSFSY